MLDNVKKGAGPEMFRFLVLTSLTVVAELLSSVNGESLNLIVAFSSPSCFENVNTAIFRINYCLFLHFFLSSPRREAGDV